jgi:hypothetical protein
MLGNFVTFEGLTHDLSLGDYNAITQAWKCGYHIGW